jgi:hypothetical protein
VAAAALIGGIGRAAPPSRYPLDLDVAIGKAYGSSLSGIVRSCTVWLNGGRDEYALADVKLTGGRRDVGALQFINTAGWFDMWRFHKATAAVPAGARATVAKLVRELATRCTARWTPSG